MESKMSGRDQQRGFTLIEVMLVVAILGLLTAISVPTFKRAIRTSRLTAIATDSTTLYTAFMRYHADHGGFPPELNPPGQAFDPVTLSPLSTSGYIESATGFTAKMQNDRMWFYWTPDVGGMDTELFTAFRTKKEPDVIVLITHTSIVNPFLDGVYLLVDGWLIRADEV